MNIQTKTIGRGVIFLALALLMAVWLGAAGPAASRAPAGVSGATIGPDGVVYGQAQPVGGFAPGLAPDYVGQVGVEWINDFPGTADDRSHWDESCDGLYNRLKAANWYGRYRWTDWSAWESDFNLGSIGGHEDEYGDAVDVAMVCTHGAGAYDSFWNQSLSSVYFGSTHPDHHLSPGDAYRAFGDVRNKFMIFDSCSVLSDGGPAPYYNRGYWSTIMNGSHLLLGFLNTMYVVAPGDGDIMGFYALGLKIGSWVFLPPLNVTQSWFAAVDWVQPTVTCARVIAESNAQFNDHLPGSGTVSAKPAVDGWYNYLDHCSTGAGKSVQAKEEPATLSPAEAELIVSMPVLQVVTRTVGTSYVQNIANALGMSGQIGTDGLNYYMLDTSGGISRTLIVSRASGGYQMIDPGGLWNAPIVTPTLPSGERAYSLALAWKKNQGDALPGNLEVNNLGNIWTETLNEAEKQLLKGETRPERPLASPMPVDVAVVFTRTYNLPVNTVNGPKALFIKFVGPGAVFKMYFGDQNKLVGLLGGARHVQVMPESVPIMTAPEAWALFLADHNVATPPVPWVADVISYTSATLGYYEMPYMQPQSELIPVWMFNANFFSSGDLLAGDVPVYVPAATQYMPMQVSITSPTEGSQFRSGETIHLSGSIVSGGKAPFTVKWSSASMGDLGSGLALDTALFPVIKQGQVFQDTITLDVTDANGQHGTAEVHITIVGNLYLPFISNR